MKASYIKLLRDFNQRNASNYHASSHIGTLRNFITALDKIIKDIIAENPKDFSTERKNDPQIIRDAFTSRLAPLHEHKSEDIKK